MTLPLFVLMRFLLSGGSARVVEECLQFFAGGMPPTKLPGPQYKYICQTLNGVAHYATYYDTANRIPVYSAYKFEGRISCNRKTSWYIEPELDMKADIKPSNMASEGSVAKELRGKHQALDEDYVNSGYDKGHLAPVFHAGSKSCADATFTLTNAAPQNPSFNSGKWRVLEKDIAEKLSKQCLPKKYSVYIVTGVTPGTSKLKNKVNVPSHFWTAYCCLDQNNKCQISTGFIGENKNIDPEEKTVNDLEAMLTGLYKITNTAFKVFDSSTDPQSTRKRTREPSE